MLSIRLLKIQVLLLLVHVKIIHPFSEPNCQEPRKPLRIRFLDPIHGYAHEYQPKRAQGYFPAFVNINNFSGVLIDFKVYEVDEDQLYSVIMMQQGTYARLEPDGGSRLKWFVANIPGSDLRRGKRHWTGKTLTEFEEMMDRDKYEFHTLWIFKHVDNKTILDEMVDDRDDFALQSFYDFLCSKPEAEILFLKKEHWQQAKLDADAAKRLVN